MSACPRCGGLGLDRERVGPCGECAGAMPVALKPQPLPRIIGGSIEVWPSLIAEYGSRLPPALVALMYMRNEQGRAKYGVPLTTHNGRDALVDAFQEALDLCAYLYQRNLEDGSGGESIKDALVLARVLHWRLERQP